MDNVYSVAVGYGCDDLLDYYSGGLFLEGAALSELVEELTTDTDLCDEVVSFLIFVELVEFNDVRVIQPFKDFYLSLEPL